MLLCPDTTAGRLPPASAHQPAAEMAAAGRISRLWLAGVAGCCFTSQPAGVPGARHGFSRVQCCRSIKPTRCSPTTIPGSPTRATSGGAGEATRSRASMPPARIPAASEIRNSEIAAPGPAAADRLSSQAGCVQPNSLRAVWATSSPWWRAPSSSILLGWRDPSPPAMVVAPEGEPPATSSSVITDAKARPAWPGPTTSASQPCRGWQRRTG